jgi:hypothetical protein
MAKPSEAAAYEWLRDNWKWATGPVKSLALAFDAFAAQQRPKPFCETCGCDVGEVLCPKCAKWWDENQQKSDAGISRCNKCGAEYPSGPVGTVHKCGACSGGFCSPIEKSDAPRQFTAAEIAANRALALRNLEKSGLRQSDAGEVRDHTLAKSPASGDVERAVMICPQCEGEGGYADGLDDNACHTECTRCGSNGWIVNIAAIAAMPGTAAEIADWLERVDWQEVSISWVIMMIRSGEWRK